MKSAALALPSLRLEGSLFLPDILEKAALGQGRLQSEADDGLPRGLKLRDEASRAFQIASAQWRSFAALLGRADFDPQRASTQFISELLRDAFAYPVLAVVSCGVPVDDRTYPITHLAHAAPAAQSAGAKPLAIVVAPHKLTLDRGAQTTLQRHTWHASSASLPCRQPGPADRSRRRPSSAQRVAATHPARDPNSQRPAPAGSAAVSVNRSSRGAALKLRPPSPL